MCLAIESIFLSAQVYSCSPIPRYQRQFYLIAMLFLSAQHKTKPHAPETKTPVRYSLHNHGCPLVPPLQSSNIAHHHLISILSHLSLPRFCCSSHSCKEEASIRQLPLPHPLSLDYPSLDWSLRFVARRSSNMFFHEMKEMASVDASGRMSVLL